MRVSSNAALAASVVGKRSGTPKYGYQKANLMKKKLVPQPFTQQVRTMFWS
ncbi:MAG: hypothetical protein Ct9H300mP28_08970 [Pseudomonadota bacterium]|nr:MAG: hypothetical protein Ct9H300mP28_08970 [Pseudomonadota bacterium]